MWCSNRGLYSNKLGYFGGVQLAITTARICQLYPCAAASTIVQKYFTVYKEASSWTNPVTLNFVERKCNTADNSLEQWAQLDTMIDVYENRLEDDGKGKGKGKKGKPHRVPLMQVITPAYPAMNSTHNVNESTRRVLMEEFARGHKITSALTDPLKLDLAQGGSAMPIWTELVEKTDFFSREPNLQ
eukprot:SAG31_NODE_1038_length_10218_cov_16.418223_11_plen_186_part_00